MNLIGSIGRLGPLILPELDASLGKNIQGPSLIEVLNWIDRPLGCFYFYCADHKGLYIWLAYADALTGLWRIYKPGSLRLSQTHFAQEEIEPTEQQSQTVEPVTAGLTLPHNLMLVLCIPRIASLDVHVDEENQKIRMCLPELERFGVRLTRFGESPNGIDFIAHPLKLARPYLRVFAYEGVAFAMAMLSVFYRLKTGRADFERGPTLFPSTMCHAVLWRAGDTLWIFWTNVGDAPEHIPVSSIDLSLGWMNWRGGADRPLAPSLRSVAYGRQGQLRDPAIFDTHDGTLHLLNALAGEVGIGFVRLSPKSAETAEESVLVDSR